MFGAENSNVLNLDVKKASIYSICLRQTPSRVQNKVFRLCLQTPIKGMSSGSVWKLLVKSGHRCK